MPEHNSTILLAEEKAKLLSEKSASLFADREIVRQWRGVPNRALEEMQTVIRARRTETNPKADLKTYSGTWRIVSCSCERGRESGTVTETLRLGLATTLPESEARIQNTTGDPKSAGFSIVRYWPYVDPNTADTLMTTLKATQSVTDPYGDSQQYTGTFWVSGIRAEKNDDLSVRITQVLTLTVADTDEADALLVAIKGDPKSAGFQLRRQWKYILPLDAEALNEDASTLLATLRGVTSVTDPEADTETYTGTFWASDCGADVAEDGTVTLWQLLTLTVADVDEADALLVTHSGDPRSAGYQMRREWRYVLPTASGADPDAASLYGTLRAVTAVTNPLADGETYTGIFWASNPTATTAADGTITLAQTLTLTVASVAAATPEVTVLRGSPNDAKGGFGLQRKWRHLIPTALETEWATLNADEEVTNPVADGQTHTGTFLASQTESTVAEDGTITVSQVLTQVWISTDNTDAKFRQVRGEPRSVGFQLVRLWDFINPTASEALLNTLKNTKSVTDPQADDETYDNGAGYTDGLFWASGVTAEKQEDNTITISQVLTLTVGDLTGDPVLIDTEGNPMEDGFQLRRGWKYVLPTVAETEVEALITTGVIAAPEADGEAYTGTFVRTSAGSEVAEDGTVTIWQLLTKVHSITGHASFNDLAPTESQALSTVHPFTEGSVYRESIEVNNVSVNKVVYRYIDPSSRATIETITPTQWALLTIRPADHGFLSVDIADDPETHAITVTVVFQFIENLDVDADGGTSEQSWLSGEGEDADADGSYGHRARTVGQFAAGTGTVQVRERMLYDQGDDTVIDVQDLRGVGKTVTSWIRRMTNGRWLKGWGQVHNQPRQWLLEHTQNGIDYLEYHWDNMKGLELNEDGENPVFNKETCSIQRCLDHYANWSYDKDISRADDGSFSGWLRVSTEEGVHGVSGVSYPDVVWDMLVYNYIDIALGVERQLYVAVAQTADWDAAVRTMRGIEQNNSLGKTNWGNPGQFDDWGLNTAIRTVPWGTLPGWGGFKTGIVEVRPGYYKATLVRVEPLP